MTTPKALTREEIETWHGNHEMRSPFEVRRILLALLDRAEAAEREVAALNTQAAEYDDKHRERIADLEAACATEALKRAAAEKELAKWKAVRGVECGECTVVAPNPAGCIVCSPEEIRRQRDEWKAKFEKADAECNSALEYADPRGELTKSGAELALLRAQLAAAEKERDELRQKQGAWLASPEAARRLDGYRELGAKCAALETQRDSARAQVAKLKALLLRHIDWKYDLGIKGDGRIDNASQRDWELLRAETDAALAESGEGT